MKVRHYPEKCIDCGRPCSGLRCSKDHGAFLLRQSLRDTAQNDADLLRMRDEEHLSINRIAERYGVSGTRAGMKVKEARRRQAKRDELGDWLKTEAFFARVEP